eukprot:Nk52_evm2s1992 gene=Nk52_evmTU2s1992
MNVVMRKINCFDSCVGIVPLLVIGLCLCALALLSSPSVVIVQAAPPIPPPEFVSVKDDDGPTDDPWVQEGCCTPSDSSCWPTEHDITRLAEDMEDGKVERNLVNGVPEKEFILALSKLGWGTEQINEALKKYHGIAKGPEITVHSQVASLIKQQCAGNNSDSWTDTCNFLTEPLVGRGRDMKAVYVANLKDPRDTHCSFEELSGGTTEFCAMAMRNAPQVQSPPLIVAWPTKAEHVVSAVKFARKHNLCVSVAGAGHDYFNRHSNGNSLLIRTSLLKSGKYNNESETFTLGAGMTDMDVGEFTRPYGRMVVHGWGATVGIVGFTTSGGEGTSSSKHGFAADNIEEAEIVTADGVLRTVNRHKDADLWWALRGAGGST